MTDLSNLTYYQTVGQAACITLHIYSYIEWTQSIVSLLFSSPYCCGKNFRSQLFFLPPCESGGYSDTIMEWTLYIYIREGAAWEEGENGSLLITGECCCSHAAYQLARGTISIGSRAAALSYISIYIREGFVQQTPRVITRGFGEGKKREGGEESTTDWWSVSAEWNWFGCSAHLMELNVGDVRERIGECVYG